MANRIVPHDDKFLLEWYKPIVDMFPECVIIEDKHGTYRFRENKIIHEYLQGKLNQIAIDVIKGKFSVIDWTRMNMELGYSLSGWLDLFDDRLWDENYQPLKEPKAQHSW